MSECRAGGGRFRGYGADVGTITIRRAYDADQAGNGETFLVDRMWPRGIRKEDLPVTGWLKDLAPSKELRVWFGHDPERWEGFIDRYTAELDAEPDAVEPLLRAARSGPVTLLYGARDTEHNNAVVLKRYVEERLRE